MFNWLNARTRQSFLILVSLGLLSACGEAPSTDSAAATAPQRSYEWKLITSWPKNLPALGTTPEYFADIVEEMSAGRMKIRVFGANELVGGLEVFDAVSSGVAEIGHSGAYYWQGKIAGTPFFSTIPFGLTGVEMNAWLDYGGGKELWREIYEPFNLYPTRGGNSGTQMFGWFNKEINSLEDIKGLKMRIPGLGRRSLQPRRRHACDDAGQRRVHVDANRRTRRHRICWPL
jgi:TRAP-type mannitol/chloroaromatic compound transport system substrate-binding protein